MTNSCVHLNALLKKNWILFKRSPCASCCEVAVPIIFVLFLLAVRSLVSKDQIPETSYIANQTIFSSSPNINSDVYKSINALAYRSNNQTSVLDILYSQNHMKYFYIKLHKKIVI